MTKKRVKIVIIILSILLVIITLSFAVRFANRSSVEVSSNPVDNSYNNRVLNYQSLVQIEDKLYYDYASGHFLYCGTYQISDNGSYKLKGVHFNTYNPFVFFNRILYPQTEKFFEHNGEIILEPDFKNVDKLKSYGSVFKTKKTYCRVGNTIGDELICSVDEYNGNLYFFTEKEVYRYDEENSKDKFNKVIDIPDEITEYIFSITAEHTYYFNNDTLYIPYPNDKTYDFYALSLNGKDKKIYNTQLSKSRSIEGVVVDNNFAIIASCGDGVGPTADSYIYRVDLENNGAVDYISKNKSRFNYYNGKVYAYGGDNDIVEGIYIIDIKDKSSKQIYYGNAKEAYIRSVFILDNEWVYFTDEYYNLYRISVDGSTLETVFDEPRLKKHHSYT